MVYPLDGNPALLHICYSDRQAARTAERSTLSHIVEQGGRKTLCGKLLYRNGQVNLLWHYDVWNLLTEGFGVKDIGCMSCRRSRKLQEVEDDGV